MDIRVNVAADFERFSALNRAWIEAHFTLEASDRKVLERPEVIVEQGGYILTLVDEGVVLGCCALLKNGINSFELAKMAVDPAHQGRGLSHQLMTASIDLARELNAVRLDLLTSSRLERALALYRKHGFTVLPQRCHPDYARCDVIMQLAL